MKNLDNNGRVIGALLLGAAIGGVLGVLFAPDKGSATRKKIMTKSDDLTDALKQKINAYLGKAKEEVQEMHEQAHELISSNGNSKTEKYNVH
ncbi:MAG TPA: YtxH domain-containing protein [Cytophagaceae bacterium]|nr:YtxH domain-containing protein [Cytophagaceae bacterium]